MPTIARSLLFLLLAVTAFLAAAPAARAAELVMFDDPSCVWCRR